MKDVLLTLRKIKNEMGTKHPKADMWCYFGKATITFPGKGSVYSSFLVVNLFCFMSDFVP